MSTKQRFLYLIRIEKIIFLDMVEVSLIDQLSRRIGWIDKITGHKDIIIHLESSTTDREIQSSHEGRRVR